MELEHWNILVLVHIITLPAARSIFCSRHVVTVPTRVPAVFLTISTEIPAFGASPKLSSDDTLLRLLRLLRSIV